MVILLVHAREEEKRSEYLVVLVIAQERATQLTRRSVFWSLKFVITAVIVSVLKLS